MNFKSCDETTVKLIWFIDTYILDSFELERYAQFLLFKQLFII